MNNLQGLFTTVLNMSLTASYVVLAVLVVRILLRKAPKICSYALWAAVLFRLLCPSSFASPFSLLGLLNVGSQNHGGALAYIPRDIGLMQTPAVQSGLDSLDRAVNASLPQAGPMASANPMQIWLGVLSFIWIAGIAVLLLYSTLSYIGMKRRLQTATLISENIYESDRIETAFVCGFIHPKIYVPVGVGDSDRAYILEHERTHIRRKDYWVKPVAFLALILHWFNPLIWLSFALMSRDMEMSCDESVLRQMNRDAKGGYSRSLLSLSVQRRRFFALTPLAFGESHVKSRIQNVLNYKKPAFWAIALAVVVTVALLVAFAANPKHDEPAPAPAAYLGYSIDELMANQTPYVGDNSKVLGLIEAMPVPPGLVRGAVEIATTRLPYGITLNYAMRDASGTAKDEVMGGDAFYRNAIVLFCLIDNVDVVHYRISESQMAEKTGRLDETTYTFTYTREEAEEWAGEDVRAFADSAETLKRLIDRTSRASFGATSTESVAPNAQIEAYLKIIASSPASSSNPRDYLQTHPDEVASILKMDDEALAYLLAQIEKSASDDLRAYIMMALCKEIMGSGNDVKDETLAPREWCKALTVRRETKLPDFRYSGQDPIEKLVYATEVESHSDSERGGFAVVAPKIFGSYKEGDRLKVFVTTFSERYKLFGSILSLESGGVIPAAITYRKVGDDYVLENYKQAEDGSRFIPSIRDYCTMPVSGKQIKGLAEKILKHYGNYEDIRNLLYENLYKHLQKNGISNATLTNSQGEVWFDMSDSKYQS